MDLFLIYTGKIEGFLHVMEIEPCGLERLLKVMFSKQAAISPSPGKV